MTSEALNFLLEVIFQERSKLELEIFFIAMLFIHCFEV